MKNILTCNSCNTENPLFAYTCKKCNAFLRSKIPNIDFWNITSSLLETPVKASEIIIQSEHKNFITVITLLSGIKIALNFWIINNAIKYNELISNSFLISITFGLLGFIIGISLIALFAYYLSKKLKVITRFKDYYAIYSYSFLPMLFIFLILSPIQIALFGTYWFTFNPSPFIIKNLPSYVIIVIEVIFFIWSFFLIICANYTQLRSIFFSIIISFIELFLLMFIILLGFYLSTYLT